MSLNHARFPLIKPDDVKLGMEKLRKAEEMLRSLDDFATSLLGKTAEALDLVATAKGLMLGTLKTDAEGTIVDAE